MKRTIIATTAILVLIVAGCSSSDPTLSDEYGELERELADTEREVADTEQELTKAEALVIAISAERDALVQPATTDERHNKATATQDLLIAIIDDPSSFGREEEVLDLVDELAVPLAHYEDTAWPLMREIREGDWRTSWRNTLFNDIPSTVTTWHTWLSDDGSTGGSLFTWEGTGGRGEPFALDGIELSKFNEDGLYTETIVYYPHTDKEVWGIVGWPPQ